MRTIVIGFICTGFAALVLSAHEPVEISAIPFQRLGAEAQKLHSGAEAAITPSAGGSLLRAPFQDLEAEVTAEGLWLRSTADADKENNGRFRVRAIATGRDASNMMRLPSTGITRTADATVSYVRPGLTEEYSVNADGVRQDFLVAEKPVGEGDLTVSLQTDGASVSAAVFGAKLTLDGSGREIAYHRLHVTDATGRELEARMEVLGEQEIRVTVDDRDAVYPVRIDPTFCDCDWISMGGTPGVEGSVYAIAADAGGNLYVGGTFTAAGGVSAANVAKWDGSSWSAMGDGISGTVHSLAVSGSLVYAGGSITGGVTCWNGHSWASLREGVNGGVQSLAMSGSKLYVGGNFTMAGSVSCNNIALWFGGNWSALGAGTNGAVAELAVSGSDLYVGGSFEDAAGVPGTSRIAKWNGSVWSSLGGGMNGNVDGMTVDGGYVYACGQFANAGGVASQWLARWNIGSASWQAIGVPGTIYSSPGAVAVHSGELYLAAYYGVGSVNHTLAKLNPTTLAWSYPSASPDNVVHAMASVGGSFYVGGTFSRVGDTAASNIARLSGSAWHVMGSGFNAPVRAIAPLGSDLYVGGDFTSTPGGPANHIAKWDGSAWSALGSGTDDTVSALVAWNGSIYAGGEFTEAGGLTVNHIASWNPAFSLWSGLQPFLGGGSVAPGTDAPVYALAASPSRLYVGGSFHVVGGEIPANAIAYWFGTNWSALGDGVTGSVYALAVSGGDLFVGGSFSAASGVPGTLNIAKWNGSVWSALGSAGANGSVNALAVSGSNLYAGGPFSEINGVAASHIARWNGSAWSSLGPPTVGHVRAIAVSGTDLFVGAVGAAGSDRIAKWDSLTNEWSALGSGVDDQVNALAVASGRIFVGGHFKTAGGKFSPSLASISRVIYSDGSLDETFGTGGKVTTDFVGSNRSSANAVAVQPDGRILAAGSARFGSNYDFALVRYMPDGDLDESFDFDGRVSTDFAGGPDDAIAVVLQPDRKIVVVGQSRNSSGFDDFAIARYNEYGTLDTSFGGDGMVTEDLGGTIDSAHGVVLQPDAKIVVAAQLMTGPGYFNLGLARFNESGELDTTFGTGGKVITDLEVSLGSRHAVVLQPNGKLLAVGRIWNGSSYVFALTRYDEEGDLDTSFGTNGIVTKNFAGDSDSASMVILQPDGKILVVATSGNYYGVDIVLARYDDDGDLDTMFGDGGTLTTVFSGRSGDLHAVALQPNGSILVAGLGPTGGVRFDLARYTWNGVLDPSFGGDGYVSADIGIYDYAQALALLPDGRIVVAGTTGVTYPESGSTSFALARFAWGPDISLRGNSLEITDGDTTPDPVDGTDMGAAPMGGGTSKTFTIRNTGHETLTLTGGPSTRVTVSPADGPFSINAISLLGSLPPCDGETSFSVGFNPTLSEHADFQTATVTVRSNDDDEDPYTFTVRACGIAPVFSDGRLDTTFDTDGKVTTSLGGLNGDFGYAAAEQTDGKIVVAGSTNSGGNTDFLLARYRIDGSLDPDFGTGGIVTTPVGTGSDTAWAVVIQTDGKILAAGSATTAGNEDFALVRYLPNGTPDPSFGSGGKVTMNFDGLSDIAFALAVQSDGLIVVAGRSFNGSNEDFAVVRYLPNGAVDATFAGGGGRYNFTGGNDEAHEVLVQGDGMIVLAGTSGSDFGLLRLDAYGVPDPAFGSFGRVTTDFGGASDEAFGAVLTSEGNILVAGASNGTVALARYLSNGTLDPAFGTGGKTTSHSGIAYDVALQPDGKIVTGGWYWAASHSDFLLARFLANGSPDTTLDGDGIITVNLTAGLPNDTAHAVIPTCDGHLLLAGTSTNGTNSDIALTRHAIAPMPEIRVEGNTRVILSGDTTPSVPDHTDFGSVGLGETLTRTFTIRNTGTADLHLTGGVGNLVSLAPWSAAPFTVSAQPASDTIPPGGTLTFAVTFSPTSPSHIVSHSAAVVIPNDDFDESACEFAITAWGARFSDGTLDETFGTGGKVSIDSPGSLDSASAMALQTDGKVVVVGRGIDSSPYWQFEVMRFDVAGNPDPTFGGTGKVLTVFGDDAFAEAVAVQEDGKIVVAGTVGDDFALVRYLPNGDLDESFNSTGKVITPVALASGASSLVIQIDGKIVVAGKANGDFAVLRYLSHGALDPSFDYDGKVTTDLTGSGDYGLDVAVDPEGRILLAGYSGTYSDSDFALVRYLPHGAVDLDFGDEGKVFTSFGSGGDDCTGLSIQNDGRIVLAGNSRSGVPGTYSRLALARYTNEGLPDATFGVAGKVLTSHEYYWSDMLIQSDGKIVVVGADNIGMAAARFNPSGQPDIQFGGTGSVAVTSFTSNPLDNGSAEAVALLPDGRLVMAGTLYGVSGSNSRFALARFAWSDGEIAVSGNGVDITDGDSTPDTADHTDFGSTCAVAGSVERVFTIANSGPDNLNLTGSPQVAITGAHADDFTVTALPSSPVANGASTTFTITFDPSASGLRTAMVSIACNDPDEHPFTFAIQGTGLTHAEVFEQKMLDAGLPVGSTAPMATPFGDGVANLLKYAFNLNLNAPDVRILLAGGTAGLPRITLEGSGAARVLRYEFVGRADCLELTYTPQKSTNLAPGLWLPLDDVPLITPLIGDWARLVYEEPAPEGTSPRLFGRVEVELP